MPNNETTITFQIEFQLEKDLEWYGEMVFEELEPAREWKKDQESSRPRRTYRLVRVIEEVIE